MRQHICVIVEMMFDNYIKICGFSGTEKVITTRRFHARLNMHGSNPLYTNLSKDGKMYIDKFAKNVIKYTCRQNFFIIFQQLLFYYTKNPQHNSEMSYLYLYQYLVILVFKKYIGSNITHKDGYFYASAIKRLNYVKV